MKKFTLFCLLTVFSLSIFGQAYPSRDEIQNSTKRPQFLNQNLRSSKIIKRGMLSTSPYNKDVSGSTASAVGYYVPGTTMNVNFTLVVTSPDNEFGDMFELTFPTGITPTGVASDPFGNATTYGQDPEALIGVTGQTITWGDNDNSFGGIEPGTHNFFVELTIDAGLTGDQTVDYFLSGDGFGTPVDASGSFVISEAPTDPDIYVTNNTSSYYTNIPLSQSQAISFSAEVGNLSSDQTNAFDLVVSVPEDSWTESIAVPVPLVSGSPASLATTGTWTPSTIGTKNITFDASVTPDANTSNNIVTETIDITDTVYAREDWVPTTLLGYGAGNEGYMGQAFDINNNISLSSVTFSLNTPTMDDITRVDIFDDNGGVPGNLVATTGDIPISIGGPNDYTIPLTAPYDASPGRYYVMVFETSTMDALGLLATDAYFESNAVFLGVAAAWNPIEDYGYNITFLVRLNVGEPPACSAPSNLAVENRTQTSADLLWTENGGSANWNIEWGLEGFTQGAGTLISTSSNPYSLTGLAIGTTYDYYVQSDCGASQSDWVGPFSFTTICDAFTTIPYYEGFEAATLEADCWSSIDQDGDGNDWFISTTMPNNGSASVVSASWTSGEGAITPENYLISPAFDLTGYTGSSLFLN
ncbi:MAG: hypothetical protein C0594_13710, partial [Marinilabiliales bacterium]